MPELPEVELQKRYLDSTSLCQTIDSLEVRDPIVLDEISPVQLGRCLSGRSFQSACRHGKHLFVKLDDGGWLGLHFGMTGELKYYRKPDEKPEFDQVLFHFQNGYQLAFVMPRKLGAIRVINSVDEFIAEKVLGPDALEIRIDRFRERFSGGRGMIKSALMNQEILAGVGNVYSDEILFQTRIHPRQQVNELGDEALSKLFHTMKDVLETAIECQANPEQFPESYLIPHRSPGETCPRCGGKVRRIEVSGRAGYYCPSCQEK